MRKYFSIIFPLLILLAIAFIVWLSLQFFFIPLSSNKSSLIFTIPKGATVTQIAAELQVKGINRNTYYFLLLAKWWGKLDYIKAGEYQIAPNATLQQLIEKLAKGQVLLHKITFPEGWTFQQFVTKLTSEPRLSHTLKNLNSESIMAIIGHSGEYPEGLFYPDTYFFTLATKDAQILRLSYRLMQKKLQQIWITRAANVPYKTAYEALIVASLIEKETAVASERPMIAGVILRRLKAGMRLQIDASVLYGVNDKNRYTLTKTDLTTDTPYNTYTRYGLPPTPIAMPGIASINAALHPASGTALYYVAKGDGSHIFSDTWQAHRVAVRSYRQHMVNLDHMLSNNDMTSQCFSAQLLQHYWMSQSE